MIFNVRVYGIYVHAEKGVLISDEFIQNNFYSKFCGGGLEFGEGPIECLVREFKEEMNLEIKVLKHLYTTDFYVESMFAPGQQVISIYYYIEPLNDVAYPVQALKYSTEEFFRENEKGDEKFRFIPLTTFNEASVSLPIDKVVAKLIVEHSKQQ